jgi:hypothetical protein
MLRPMKGGRLVRSMFMTSVTVVLSVLPLGAGAAPWGCGTETSSTVAEPSLVSGTMASTAGPADLSFEETWAASLAALEGLGPTRVSIVETTQGQVTGDETPPEQSKFGPQTEKTEQLLDITGGRARLTVHTSDQMVRTTVARGKEQMSTISQPLTNPDLVSVSRYISLEAPEGLSLPEGPRRGS